MIIESQIRLNEIFPRENLDTSEVTVKQEIAFIDETSVMVKIEPIDEDEPVYSVSVAEETPIKKRGRPKKVPRTEENLRKSSRSGINRSYDEDFLEAFEENGKKKRGRPKKSNQISKLPNSGEPKKLENSRESSPESSINRFDNPQDADSSDDDFKLPKIEFEEIQKTKKPPKSEIFATCEICPAAKKIKLYDENDVKIHNEYVHEDPQNPFFGPFKCKNCPKVITTEVKIRKHVRLFHIFGNEKLCTTCGKKFYDRRAFYCHIDKNHGIRVSFKGGAVRKRRVKRRIGPDNTKNRKKRIKICLDYVCSQKTFENIN